MANRATQIDDPRLILATLRRCRGQIARPPGVSGDEVRRCTELGFLIFHEWPSGHYAITPAGQSFIFDHTPSEDA